MNFRQWVLNALLLSAFTACGCGSKGPAAEPDDKVELRPILVETSKVSVKEMDTVVQARGTFAAPQGALVKVGAVSAGRITKVLVREGDHVTAGQLVAVLDGSVQSAQANSASAGMSQAEVQAIGAKISSKAAKEEHEIAVKLANLSLQTAKTERDSEVKLANLAVKGAQLDLDRVVAGNRRQEVNQAVQTVAQARVTRDGARREEQRNSLLLEKGIVSQKAYDDSKAAFQNADAALRTAQAQLSLMQEGSRKEDIESARTKLLAAKQSLVSAESIGTQKVLQAETALVQAKQGIVQVQIKQQEELAAQQSAMQKSRDYDAAKAIQAQSEIRSPISGRVSHRWLNPGDTPDNASPILEVSGSREDLDFIASVSSSDGQLVRMGMSATISSTDDGTDSISGVVASIGNVDGSTGLQSIRISFPKGGKRLSVGSFSTALILLARHPSALAIPKQSVLTKDGDTIVYVVAKEKAVLTKIKTGAENKDSIEVLSGLKEGQKVVTLGNYELTDGADITEAVSEKGDPKDAKGEKGN